MASGAQDGVEPPAKRPTLHHTSGAGSVSTGAICSSGLGEELLGLVFAFGRAKDLARGLAVNRHVRRVCTDVLDAGTRVEAVLLNTPSDPERMLKEAIEALHAQCKVGAVVVLHTKFPGARKCVAALLGGLVEASVLPPLPRFAASCEELHGGRSGGRLRVSTAQVYGVLGRTASGHAMEIENNRPAVLVMLLPARLAQLRAGSDFDELLPSWPRSGASTSFGSASMVLSADADDSVCSRLPPGVFGGVARGKTTDFFEPSHGVAVALQMRHVFKPVSAIVIRWLGGSDAMAGAHVQTMANGRYGPRQKQRVCNRAIELINRQRDEAFTITGAACMAPEVVLAFPCNARGAKWYQGEESFEAKALHNSYAELTQDQGDDGSAHKKSPALFGMFCGGEIGPSLPEESDSDDSNELGHSIRHEHVDSATCLVLSSGEVKPTTGIVDSSRIHGFTTVVGVIGVASRNL